MTWFKVVLTVVMALSFATSMIKIVQVKSAPIRFIGALDSFISLVLIFGIWNWL